MTATTESWQHGLEVQTIRGERLARRGQAKVPLLDYIEVDCDRLRFLSALSYLRPEQYELAPAA